MVKVTVVTSVYDKETSIDRCIQSVLKQDYRNIEYILVDDSSPDRCPEICEQYARNDNRIRVIHRPNGGHARAVNTGILESTGQYITILDADDYFSDSKAIGLMVKTAEENDCDIVVTDFLRVWTAENPPRLLQASGIDMLVYFVETNAYHPTTRSRLFRRNVFWESNLFKDLICDDEEWTPKAFYNAQKVCVIPQAIYFRTTPHNSVTRSNSEENLLRKGVDRATTSGLVIDFFESQCVPRGKKKKIYKRFIALYVSSLYIYTKLTKKNNKAKLRKALRSNRFVLGVGGYLKYRVLAGVIGTVGIRGASLFLKTLVSARRSMLGGE